MPKLKPRNIAKLDNIPDVNAGSPSDNDALTWDNATNKWIPGAAGAAGASIELDNLGVVAINTSLVSDTDSTDDLGSDTKFWANAYLDKIFISNSQSLTEISMSGVGLSAARQGIMLQNTRSEGVALLVIKGGSGGYSGEIIFDSYDTANVGFMQMDSAGTLSVRSDANLLLGGLNVKFTNAGGTIIHELSVSRFYSLYAADLGKSDKFWDETFTDELILKNVGAAAAAVNTIRLSAVDLSAGNTILDIDTEGTGVVGTGTPAADRTVAIAVNGTTYYLIASTVAT